MLKNGRKKKHLSNLFILVAFLAFCIVRDTESVSASVNKRLRKLETNISAHSLRHTFVTRMRDVEAPLEVIQYILGRRIPSEAMTGGYGSKKLLSLKHRYILMIAGKN